jgi:hypothetical protein
MKLSEALEKYLEARDSLNHPFCHQDRKIEMRKIMSDCAKRMDELTASVQSEADPSQ